MLELLSSDAPQWTLLEQYGLQPGPLLFVAALLGWVRISPRLKASPRALLLAGTVVALVVAGQVPALGSWNDGAAARTVASEVPADASVGASSDLATMLAEPARIGMPPSPDARLPAVRPSGPP